jgi:MFS family permease
MANAGMVMGPAVGGLLTDLWGWRFVFWANVPVIFALLVWCLRFSPAHAPARGERSLDLPGLGLFGGAIGLLLFTINRAPNWGIESPVTIGLALAAVLLGVAFIRRERSTPTPMLDLSLFARPAFATAIGSGMANHVAVAGVLFLVPFFLVEQHGLRAGPAGLIVIPMSILMMCIAAGSGLVSDRLGTKTPSVLGLVCMSAALVGVMQLVDRLTPSSTIVCLLLFGLGTGLFTVPNTAAVMSAASRDRLGVIGGIVHTARYVGIIGGIALVGALYTVGYLWDPSDPFLGYRIAFGALAALVGLGAVLTVVQGVPEETEPHASPAPIIRGTEPVSSTDQP